MDTRINLSQVPFFLDENCILMCVHKDERKSRSSCLFVFSSCPPSHSRCNRSKNFVLKYFWMAAIDVYGFLRRFAVLEIGECRAIVYLFPFLLSQLAKRDIYCILAALSHTINVCQEYIIPRCLTIFCSAAFMLRFTAFAKG